MHTFQINVLIQLCYMFEHLVLIIRSPFVHAMFYGTFFMLKLKLT